LRHSVSLFSTLPAIVLVSDMDSPIVDRHCEPTGRANARPMTGSAKQSMPQHVENGLLRRFAPRNDGN
jgi:hypothetical protein